MLGIDAKLRAKPALLVLDNFETPLHSDERATENLLRELVAIPGVAVMISLRGRETIARVPWTERVRLDPLPRDMARAVFLAIADNVRPDDPDLEYFLDESQGVPLSLTLMAKRASGEESLATLRREWERRGVTAVDASAAKSRRGFNRDLCRIFAGVAAVGGNRRKIVFAARPIARWNGG